LTSFPSSNTITLENRPTQPRFPRAPSSIGAFSFIAHPSGLRRIILPIVKRRVLRRGLLCAALGTLAGFALWASVQDFRARDAVLAALSFAVASFIPMTIWGYVASNFFGKKK